MQTHTHTHTLAVLIGRWYPSGSSSVGALPKVSSIVSEEGGCGEHMLGTRSPVAWLTCALEQREG